MAKWGCVWGWDVRDIIGHFRLLLIFIFHRINYFPCLGWCHYFQHNLTHVTVLYCFILTYCINAMDLKTKKNKNVTLPVFLHKDKPILCCPCFHWLFLCPCVRFWEYGSRIATGTRRIPEQTPVLSCETAAAPASLRSPYHLYGPSLVFSCKYKTDLCVSSDCCSDAVQMCLVFKTESVFWKVVVCEETVHALLLTWSSAWISILYCTQRTYTVSTLTTDKRGNIVYNCLLYIPKVFMQPAWCWPWSTIFFPFLLSVPLNAIMSATFLRFDF